MEKCIPFKNIFLSSSLNHILNHLCRLCVLKFSIWPISQWLLTFHWPSFMRSHFHSYLTMICEDIIYVKVAILKISNQLFWQSAKSLYTSMLVTDRGYQICLYKEPQILFRINLVKSWLGNDFCPILYSSFFSFLGLRFVWWPNNMLFPRRE